MQGICRLLILIFVASLAGFFGGFLGVKMQPLVEVAEQYEYIEESEFVFANEKISPAVVSIIASKDLIVFPFMDPASQHESFLGYKSQEISGGTGFIVSPDGMILTNKHVIHDKDAEYKAILSDGREYTLKLLSEDPFNDIAVVKIEAESLPTAVLGGSTDLKVGQRVMAIGNALAVYGNTVTTGIISAMGREIFAYNDLNTKIENLSGLIQTDAAINLGNSGGPLVNLKGEVIGMNVAVAELANNIGFAIPVDDIKPILESMEKYGEIIRPVLGINFVMLNVSQARQINPELDHGAIIVKNPLSSKPAVLPGGAGLRAGLREGDVIASVDGIDVDEKRPLHKIIRGYNPGDKIKLVVWRDGKKIVITVELGSSKEI